MFAWKKDSSSQNNRRITQLLQQELGDETTSAPSAPPARVLPPPPTLPPSFPVTSREVESEGSQFPSVPTTVPRLYESHSTNSTSNLQTQLQPQPQSQPSAVASSSSTAAVSRENVNDSHSAFSFFRGKSKQSSNSSSSASAPTPSSTQSSAGPTAVTADESTTNAEPRPRQSWQTRPPVSRGRGRDRLQERNRDRNHDRAEAERLQEVQRQQAAQRALQEQTSPSLSTLTRADVREIEQLGKKRFAQLVEMGFPVQSCRLALKHFPDSVQGAINFCLEHDDEFFTSLLVQDRQTRREQLRRERMRDVYAEQQEAGFFSRMISGIRRKNTSSPSSNGRVRSPSPGLSDDEFAALPPSVQERELERARLREREDASPSEMLRSTPINVNTEMYDEAAEAMNEIVSDNFDEEDMDELASIYSQRSQKSQLSRGSSAASIESSSSKVASVKVTSGIATREPSPDLVATSAATSAATASQASIALSAISPPAVLLTTTTSDSQPTPDRMASYQAHQLSSARSSPVTNSGIQVGQKLLSSASPCHTEKAAVERSPSPATTNTQTSERSSPSNNGGRQTPVLKPSVLSPLDLTKLATLTGSSPTRITLDPEKMSKVSSTLRSESPSRGIAESTAQPIDSLQLLRPIAGSPVNSTELSKSFLASRPIPAIPHKDSAVSFSQELESERNSYRDSLAYSTTPHSISTASSRPFSFALNSPFVSPRGRVNPSMTFSLSMYPILDTSRSSHRSSGSADADENRLSDHRIIDRTASQVISHVPSSMPSTARSDLTVSSDVIDSARSTDDSSLSTTKDNVVNCSEASMSVEYPSAVIVNMSSPRVEPSLSLTTDSAKEANDCEADNFNLNVSLRSLHEVPHVVRSKSFDESEADSISGYQPSVESLHPPASAASFYVPSQRQSIADPVVQSEETESHRIVQLQNAILQEIEETMHIDESTAPSAIGEASDGIMDTISAVHSDHFGVEPSPNYDFSTAAARDWSPIAAWEATPAAVEHDRNSRAESFLVPNSSMTLVLNEDSLSLSNVETRQESPSNKPVKVSQRIREIERNLSTSDSAHSHSNRSSGYFVAVEEANRSMTSEAQEPIHLDAVDMAVATVATVVPSIAVSDSYDEENEGSDVDRETISATTSNTSFNPTEEVTADEFVALSEASATPARAAIDVDSRNAVERPRRQIPLGRPPLQSASAHSVVRRDPQLSPRTMSSISERSTSTHQSVGLTAGAVALAEIDGEGLFAAVPTAVMIGGLAGDSIADLTSTAPTAGRRLPKRALCPFRVLPTDLQGSPLSPSQVDTLTQQGQLRTHVRFRGVVSLRQPRLGGNEVSPQGTKPNFFTVGLCATESMCTTLCEAIAPPVWHGQAEKVKCYLCELPFAFFNPGHHCRNCGQFVCVACSDKFWPGTMIPSTYHDGEKRVRVCHTCHLLAERFITALREGDEQLARMLCGSGNINLHHPFTLYAHWGFPVHLAAAGGNLSLLRWLVEEQKCSLLTNERTPLKTQSGLTVLGVAALAGHVDVIRYLVHEKNARVEEITDICILQRAMHALVFATYETPSAKRVHPQYKGLPSTHEDFLFAGGLDGLEARERSREQNRNAVIALQQSPNSSVRSAESPLPSASNRRSIGRLTMRELESERARERQLEQDRSREQLRLRAAAAPSELPLAGNVTEVPLVLDRRVVCASAERNVFNVHFHSTALNGVTAAVMTAKGKNKALCSHAVLMVDSFIEEQQAAFVIAEVVSLGNHSNDRTAVANMN